MGPLSIIVAFVIAAATALSLTWVSVVSGETGSTVKVGAWRVGPRHGTSGADPYARATFARLGTLPLSLADGLTLAARHDSSGKALDGRCTIRIAGRLPPARFWTLTLVDREGALIENPALRYGFTSAELTWPADGSMEIVAAPRARAGNWLPTGGNTEVTLILRLYDTPSTFGARARNAPPLPAIRQEGCP